MNRAAILEDIADLAIRYGRSFSDITLVAVTKQIPWNIAEELYKSGQRDFGESRYLSALEKQLLAPKDCRWHLIGSLQKNKVRKAIEHFSLIHSVDSFELACKISDLSQELGITTSILLQANVSQELSKHGLTEDQWKLNWESLLKLPSLSIEGLMTMAPIHCGELHARRIFSNLRKLRDDLLLRGGASVNLHHLSMGMSDDFRWAIAEGATLVRIGRALFT